MYIEKKLDSLHTLKNSGLTELEISIIELLKNNPTLGTRKIARLLGVPSWAASRRIISLRKFGFLRGVEL